MNIIIRKKNISPHTLLSSRSNESTCVIEYRKQRRHYKHPVPRQYKTVILHRPDRESTPGPQIRRHHVQCRHKTNIQLRCDIDLEIIDAFRSFEGQDTSTSPQRKSVLVCVKT